MTGSLAPPRHLGTYMKRIGSRTALHDQEKYRWLVKSDPQMPCVLSLHGAQQIHHLDGALGALSPLVAGLGARPLDGLLDGVGGEDTE